MVPTATSNGTGRAASATPTRPMPALTRVAAQRNRSRLAAGGLLLVICTLGAVVVFGKVGDRQSVLVMARTVEVGDVVEAGDLRTVRVSADPGVQTVSASARSQVVGRPAAVRLISGSLLSPQEVGGDSELPKGMVLVGAILKAGQFPLSLTPGDTVALVGSGTDGSAAEASSAKPVAATVVAMEPAADASGATAVSLQLPAAAASDAAMAGAAGRLHLVVVKR